MCSKAGFALVLGFGCLVLGASADANGPPTIGSYLYRPAACMDTVLRGPAVAYLPQPGDVMLATDDNRFWRLTHNLAFAGEPHNSALVFARPDGSLAILEAGPNDTMRVSTLDMLPHLKEYHDKGPVWIRKRRVPLTPEQSCRLTQWALKQDGKWFALPRLGAQLTPFRSRGPLRTFYVGGPHGDRAGYFCSELVTESLVYCGALDPTVTRPAATYPHDLFHDWSYNLFINRHPPLKCDWEQPARWTYCPR